MDDEPMWVIDHVVALTLGSAINIPKTANEFAIKALFDRLLREIRAFSQLKNESLTDAWLRIKAKTLDLDDDDMPMSREEEAKFMKTFCKTHFYNDYRDRYSNRDNWRSNGRNDYNYPSNTDDKPYDLQKQFNNFMKSQQSTNAFVKNHQASIQNLETKFDRLADKQSSRASGSLPSNTQSNPRCGKAYQPPQACNVHKQLNLGVGIERMIFNDDSAMKHSYSNDDTCFSIDVINEILEKDYDALLDEGSKILYSIEGTLLEEEIFSKFDEFMAMIVDENYKSKSDNEEPPFEKITINTDYKIKTFLEELLTDL
nr:hypothetical protein [Tanacetum cinerariifolium]